MSAAMYYGYTDRVPGAWHIGVDNRSARNKFKLGRTGIVSKGKFEGRIL